MAKLIHTSAVKRYLSNLPPPSIYDFDSIFELRTHVILLTLIFTGARAQEICNLHHSDVLSDNQRIEFYFRTLKRGADRTISVSSKKILSYFKHYRKLWSPSNPKLPFLITSEPGVIPPYRKLVSRAVDQFLPEYSPHSFRHHFAMILLLNRIPIHSVQHLLGHRRLETTSKYLHHLASLDASQVMNKLTRARHGNGFIFV